MSDKADILKKIKSVVANKPRGFRGPEGQQLLVEVRRGDLRELAKDHLDNEVVTALYQASEKGKPDDAVAIYADDAYQLIEVQEKPKHRTEREAH